MIGPGREHDLTPDLANPGEEVFYDDGNSLAELDIELQSTKDDSPATSPELLKVSAGFR
ncbi:hypothetical protein ACFQ1L_33425 [Phytohabitans flavus]|uniref:hypothetical protein n=1 Tax=Phytohabitans flavus TaxID=1076124 RepID=UPI001562FADC|nr:hypothetical protein [Phytohabitans flavus]